MFHAKEELAWSTQRFWTEALERVWFFFGRNVAAWARMFLFTNLDLADILGRRDSHFVDFQLFFPFAPTVFQ